MGSELSSNVDRIKQRLTAIKEDLSKPYFIRYRIEAGRFSKEEAIGDNDGLTQDLVYISCITNPDGSYSQIWNATNGETGEPLHHADVFKAWILMASSLRQKEDLDAGTREFLDLVFETWRQSVLKAA